MQTKRSRPSFIIHSCAFRKALSWIIQHGKALHGSPVLYPNGLRQQSGKTENKRLVESGGDLSDGMTYDRTLPK